MRKNIDKVELKHWKLSYLFWKTSERYLKRLAKLHKDQPIIYKKYIESFNESEENKIHAKNKIDSIKKKRA